MQPEYSSFDPKTFEEEDVVEVLREGLAALQAGDRGVPLEEFDRDFRQRHGLPPRSIEVGDTTTKN